MMRAIPLLIAISLAACASAPAQTSGHTDSHVHGTAPAPAGEASVTLTGPTGQTLTVTAANLAGMPRATVDADFHGQKHTFEGVPLTELLKQVGAPNGATLRGGELTQVVIITARDGYRVALSLAETDPAVSPTRVILADRADGAAIADADGPFRLVVEGDLKPARSARMVTSIEVRKLD